MPISIAAIESASITAPTSTRRVHADAGRTAVSAVTTKYADMKPPRRFGFRPSRAAMIEPLIPIVSIA